MSYLLDTNVLSETIKPLPAQSLVDWLSVQREADLWVSTVTLGEIERGLRLLPEGKRRKSLLAWLERLRARFENRILDIDDAVMRTWAKIFGAESYRQGIPDAFDSLLSATAAHHGLTMVTRNEKDFPANLAVINPWKG